MGDKLQALVYDILPSTTAVFSYAIVSRKLLANEQFFVGAQTVVSLLQTTQITLGARLLLLSYYYSNLTLRASLSGTFLQVEGRVSKTSAWSLPEPFRGR